MARYFFEMGVSLIWQSDIVWEMTKREQKRQNK